MRRSGPRPIFVDPYQASKHSEEQFKKVISDRRSRPNRYLPLSPVPSEIELG